MRIPLTITLYKLFTRVFEFFSLPIFVLRAFKKKEEWSRKKERFGFINFENKKKKYIWFHAVSVGELLSILPLTKKLSENDFDILITTSTISSAKLFKKIFPKNIKHQYIPYDFPKCTKRFFESFKIEIAIFVESEIWPNFILSCKKLNIPIMLINARISDKSFNNWKYAKSSLLYLLESFRLIFPQNEKAYNRIKSLGIKNTGLIGNIKHDAEILSVNQNKIKHLREITMNKELIVAASTHEGEEEIIFSLFNKLKSDFSNLLLVLAPRHPERALSISKLASKSNIKKIKFLSKNESCSENIELLIYDKIGELGEIYSLADLVILGGAFKEYGGHNPIEPAKFSIPIFTGPNFFNFEDDFNKLLLARGANIFKEDEFIKLFKNKDNLIKMGKNARKCVSKLEGTSNKIYKFIEGIKVNEI